MTRAPASASLQLHIGAATACSSEITNKWREEASCRSLPGYDCWTVGRVIGTSARILYCCTRGLLLSASFTYWSELLPIDSRGRIITRMKRLGRSLAACAKTGSGPVSYHAPPGP